MQTAHAPQSPAASLPQQDAQVYLETLETLAQELERGMQAIAQKSLPAFEDSVSRQLAGCARLTAIPRRATALPADSAAAPAADLALRIAEASAALLTLNKRYAALLKHTGDTMRLFAGLFHCYNGQSQQETGSRANLHTWSCEL